MSKKLSLWLPVILWLCVIFYFSNQPDLPGNKFDWLDYLVKKTAHIAEFFILTILTFRAFQRKLPDYAIVFALAIAFSDEIHQLFTPNRGAKLSDVIIDALGISLASLTILKFKLRAR